MPLSNKVVKNLIKLGITISVSESCTGGLISSKISKISGVSKIFASGLVCYSNNSKIKYLSISKKLLSKYGAVSSKIAEEMINNLYKQEKTEITISTTGIAGPMGGTQKKPVGLVYIGIRYNNKNHIFKKNYKGSRIEIQRKTSDFVFRKINELI